MTTPQQGWYQASDGRWYFGQDPTPYAAPPRPDGAGGWTPPEPAAPTSSVPAGAAAPTWPAHVAPKQRVPWYRDRRWAAGIGAAAVVLFIIALAGGGDSDSLTTADNGPARSSAPKPTVDRAAKARSDAAKYVDKIDANVLIVNTQLTALKQSLDAASKGNADDTDLALVVRRARESLDAVRNDFHIFDAPNALEDEATSLASAANLYKQAMTAMLEWLDTGAPSKQATAVDFVQQGNSLWGPALDTIYKAAGRTPPKNPLMS